MVLASVGKGGGGGGGSGGGARSVAVAAARRPCLSSPSPFPATLGGPSPVTHDEGGGAGEDAPASMSGRHGAKMFPWSVVACESVSVGEGPGRPCTSGVSRISCSF